MKQLENEVIASMRTAIEHLDTDLAVAREQMYQAHDLFADHLMEWSRDFCILYNQMLAIHRAHTLMPTGHWRTTSIGVGYSSFPVRRWVTDKEQAPRPTARELTMRFDVLIQAWHTRSDCRV